MPGYELSRLSDSTLIQPQHYGRHLVAAQAPQVFSAACFYCDRDTFHLGQLS